MTVLHPVLLAPGRPAARPTAATSAQPEAFGSALDAAVRTQDADRGAAQDAQQPPSADALPERTHPERMHAPADSAAPAPQDPATSAALAAAQLGFAAAQAVEAAPAGEPAPTTGTAGEDQRPEAPIPADPDAPATLAVTIGSADLGAPRVLDGAATQAPVDPAAPAAVETFPAAVEAQAARAAGGTTAPNAAPTPAAQGATAPGSAARPAAPQPGAPRPAAPQPAAVEAPAAQAPATPIAANEAVQTAAAGTARTAAVGTPQNQSSAPGRPTERTVERAPAPAAAAAPAAAPVVVAPQSSAPAVVAAAPAPAVPVDPTAFHAQLKAPVLAIAAAEGGDSIVTLTVQPERLGPVTVRALIGADGQLRVELFAPNEAGREALRTIAADLRRDLGDAGAGTRLDVSADDAPGRGARDGSGRDALGRDGLGRDGSGARDGAGERGTARDAGRAERAADLAAVSAAGSRAAHPLSTIDLLV